MTYRRELAKTTTPAQQAAYPVRFRLPTVTVRAIDR